MSKTPVNCLQCQGQLAFDNHGQLECTYCGWPADELAWQTAEATGNSIRAVNDAELVEAPKAPEVPPTEKAVEKVAEKPPAPAVAPATVPQQSQASPAPKPLLPHGQQRRR